VRGFAPIGVLARPSATCLEYAIVSGVFHLLGLGNSCFSSQVWAREKWNTGIMGWVEEKYSFFTFYYPLFRYSIIPCDWHTSIATNI